MLYKILNISSDGLIAENLIYFNFFLNNFFCNLLIAEYIKINVL